MVARTLNSAYVTMSQGASYTNVTERTLRRYIADGRLPAYRLGPRQIRLKVADLDDLFRQVPTVQAG